MKKVIIGITIFIIVIIGIVVVINNNKDINKKLSKYEKSESDGFEQNTGYIVSNKTKEGYRYGYINSKGKMLLKVEYNDIYRIQNNQDEKNIYLIASKDGRYGVSINGDVLINYDYQYIEYNNTNNLFILKRGNKYGVVDINGKNIIPIVNSNIQINGINIYVENKDEKYVTDYKGNRVEVDYNTALNPTENEKYFIKTSLRDENYYYKICDKNGNDLIAREYTYLEYAFGDYFIASNEEGVQGLIDINENVKIGFMYDLVQHIEKTNTIRTLNLENNVTEIFSSDIQNICTLTNATIEVQNKKIKVYNEKEELEFDLNGK